jgi:uncharacterized membrane protein
MARLPRWLRAHFEPEDLEAVRAAIEAAEARTSGEIRVHLERRLPRGGRGHVLEHARRVFVRLGLHRTRRRNGVLIYLALGDRHLAVVGDDGIHARVGDAYWAGLRDRLAEGLRAGRPRDAVLAAVREVGQVLATHFPPEPGDVDELSDEVSLG